MRFWEETYQIEQVPGERLGVLSDGQCRGTAIPVAWSGQPGTRREAS
jgi:hypothetical protein